MSAGVLQSRRMMIVFNHVHLHELKDYIIEIQRSPAKEVVTVEGDGNLV